MLELETEKYENLKQSTCVIILIPLCNCYCLMSLLKQNVMNKNLKYFTTKTEASYFLELNRLK